ncbi:uncharacterized protein CBL_09893 [Carabus blaptoides fortunei]
MCCWSVRVTVTVTGNLVLRVCADLTDAVCKLLLAWWCSSSTVTAQGQKSSVSDITSIQSRPWFVATDRKGAEALLQPNTVDGSFLVRPSSKADNVASLSVVQGGRVFHINLRRRHDGWLALGKLKEHEHCFASVQDVVQFYQQETLVINSDGQQHLTQLVDTLTVVTELELINK